MKYSRQNYTSPDYRIMLLGYLERPHLYLFLCSHSYITMFFRAFCVCLMLAKMIKSMKERNSEMNLCHKKKIQSHFLGFFYKKKC